MLLAARRRALRVAAGLHARSASSDALPAVAFVGLGQMGSRMAGHLLRAGHRVTACDASEDALTAARGAGAIAASTPREAAASVSIVLTSLPSPAAVREVYEHPERGVMAGAPPGALLVDTSTTDADTARALAARAGLRGLRMLDAPVSGGVAGADAASLTFMVGGSGTDVQAARPVLSALGSKIVHCGGPGCGQVVKLVNNLILAVSMIGVAEGMNLGARLGVDPITLAAVINSSSARCWSSETYNPVPGITEGAPAGRGYTGGFGSRLMLKDLRLALQSATEAGAAMPLGAEAHAVYSLMCSHGYESRDFSAVYKFLTGGHVGSDDGDLK